MLRKKKLRGREREREREREMKPAKKMTCGGSHDEHEVELGYREVLI
jgi:hypothetical protein